MRVIASQKLPRDSGESIFAARHQDVSQGPLGRGWAYRNGIVRELFFGHFLPLEATEVDRESLEEHLPQADTYRD